MEAVPRLHMLWFALKSSPEGTSFVNLKKYIAEFYHEDPESYTKEVFALETLRNQAMRTTKDGCSVMKRYYCQLHSLQHRFPQLSERGLFSFTWKDLYQNNVHEVTDMRFELAAVLFNIAASHTQVGASVTRGDVDGMKLACTHFQCAAWSFGELRERYTHVNSGGDFMTAELLVFMQQVCYAQAQECILEKSLIDNRKPNIVAKVTAQIVVYYGAALAALLTGGDDGPVAQVIDANVYKLWKKYVRFKINYLHCILYLYQGQNAEEQRKMGERVTLYQAAWDKLEEARKESKGLPDQKEIVESLIFTADVVEAKRKNAKNENEFIYHESVPELSTISAVQGANLVNGISFSISDPEVAGEDIFARLVPMKAHEASSMYSEEKAKLLRKYGTKIEEKDTELTTYMSSLTLDNLNINEEKANKLPQGIVDRCAALHANKSAITDLIAAMSQLAEITTDVETNLGELAQMLQQEEQEEREFQTQTGVPRTPNPHITELTREYQKYLEAHTRAGESNNTLRKAMSMHVNNLKILARPLPEIQQLMPKLSAELNTAEIFKDVKLIVNKVNEMKAQRAQFHADLRIAVNDDDITAKVIAHGSDEGLQMLFDRELAKHERLSQLIDQNLLAQQNILQALTESYAKAAPVLKTLADVKQKRENFFSSLAASYDVYEDLLAKSAKGLEFYKKLAGNVQKLLTRFKAARDVQSEERQQRQKSIVQNTTKYIKPTSTATSTPLPASPVYNITTTNTPTSGGAPKLRDYLKAKNTNAASIAAGGVAAAAALNDVPTAVAYVPPVRPVPVGSENPTQAACSGNNYYNAAASTAPNEPPPPYSLQQQQYFDPAAAGYTNPMYQQQQHIAPPAYKLQASPNSQFNNLNANMANLTLQQQQNYQQEIYAQQQQNMSYAQQGQTNALAYNYNNNANQYPMQPNTQTAYENQTNAYNASATNMPGAPQQQQQQQFYNHSTQQHFNYQQTATANVSNATHIPTTQPLYVSTVNQPDAVMQVPAALQAPYVVNPLQQQQQQVAAAVPQQQQLPTAQQQQQPLLQQQQVGTFTPQQQLPTATQQQILQPQQQVAIVNPQQQLSAAQSQQQAPTHLATQATFQQQQQPPAATSPAPPPTVDFSYQAYTPAQQQPTQPPVAPSPTPSNVGYVLYNTNQQTQPKAAATAQSSATSATAAYYSSSSATNHPGYSFNPQTGNYDYSSGYQQHNDSNNSAPQHYGQFTFTNQLTTVGTTNSESANKINLATGFDSPVISHTKAAEQNMNATPDVKTVEAEKISNYYTPPYGYHSNGNSNYASPAPTPFGQETQATYEPQAAPTPPPPAPQNYQQKSLYMQSGSSSIADTQTTKSSVSYASSSQHTPTPPATAAQAPTTPKAAAALPTTTKKQTSNIDLLSDIDFSDTSLNVPPPILPQPVLQPQVVSTPPASQVAAPTTTIPPELHSVNKAAAVQPPNSLPTTPVSPSKPLNLQPMQLNSPQLDYAAARKSSLDNLSNCSDLSSIENFDWDSVSVSASATTHSINDKPQNYIAFQMKPYDAFKDEKIVKYFHKEVERYEKTIESLNVKMLNGNTQLTAKWKELQDLLAKDTTNDGKRTTTIAKLFPEKNRSLDCLPYDHARVKLNKDTDDYINAAYLKNLGAGCPNFIIAQTPQQNTLNDFWAMIWEQKARTVACLHTTNEMLDPYWPQTLEQQLNYDDFTVRCVEIVNLSHSIEYRLKLSMHGADPIIDLSVLQIKQWSKALPTQVIGIARNALETHQQRCLNFNTPSSPLIMNCLTGSERSELVGIAICAIMATHCKRPILINVVDVWSRICAQRQNSLRDTSTLEQSMQIVLSHAHDVLNKRGIITSYQMKTAPQVASKEQQEVKDPLNDLDALWKMK